MLHEEPICLFISRKFRSEVFASQPFQRMHQYDNVREHRPRHCENLKELVYIPNILHHAAFTTLLIRCQTYQGDWRRSAQWVSMACDWKLSNSSLPQADSGTSGVTSSQPTFHGHNEDFGVLGALGSVS